LTEISFDSEYGQQYDWIFPELLLLNLPEHQHSQSRITTIQVLIPGHVAHSGLPDKEESLVAVTVVASLPKDRVILTSNSNTLSSVYSSQLRSVKEIQHQQHQHEFPCQQFASESNISTVIATASALDRNIAPAIDNVHELRQVRGRAKKIRPWSNSLMTFVIDGTSQRHSSSGCLASPSSSSAIITTTIIGGVKKKQKKK